MSKSGVLGALLAVGMMSALPKLAAGPETPAEAVIDRLIAELGSDKYTEREGASRRLEAAGEPALPALRKAAAMSADPEVRRRAEHVIQTIHARRFGQVRRFDGHSE